MRDKMSAQVLRDCCGCFDLKRGSFIIAYFNLIGICCATLFNTACLWIIPVLMKEKNTTPEESTILVVAAIVVAIFLFFLLLAFAFAIVLVVGLHKNRPGHLKAYLVYSMVFMVVNMIRFIVTVSYGASNIVENLFAIGLCIYFFLVIRSRYYQMKEESGEGIIYEKSTV